jgi:hypothetical protein
MTTTNAYFLLPTLGNNIVTVAWNREVDWWRTILCVCASQISPNLIEPNMTLSQVFSADMSLDVSNNERMAGRKNVIWYGHYAIGDYYKLIFCNIIRSVMTWRLLKVMGWIDHYSRFSAHAHHYLTSPNLTFSQLISVWTYFMTREWLDIN